jgi:regulator of replication initiation timing
MLRSSPITVQPQSVIRSGSPRRYPIRDYASPVISAGPRYADDVVYVDDVDTDRTPHHILLKKSESDAFFKREEDLNPVLRKLKTSAAEQLMDKQELEVTRLKKEADLLKKQLAAARNNQRSFSTYSESATIAKLQRENAELRRALGDPIVVSHASERSRSAPSKRRGAAHTDGDRLKRINKKKFNHVQPRVYNGVSSRVVDDDAIVISPQTSPSIIRTLPSSVTYGNVLPSTSILDHSYQTIPRTLTAQPTYLSSPVYLPERERVYRYA